jgi:hypothetical protein
MVQYVNTLLMRRRPSLLYHLFLFIQRVLGPIPDRWLDLLGLSGEAAVPQWLFTNWTLVRQHTTKQVP